MLPAALCVIAVAASVTAVTRHPLVLVISFDAFRHDYVRANMTPSMVRLRAASASPPYMKSVFPTKTFVNHFTMATGLYAETHGVLDNYMFNRSHGLIHYTYEQFHYDNTVVPLWVENENYGDGRHSGVMMWPGSDFEYQGKLSTYVQKYNRSMPWNDRVDKIMSWIKDDNKPANLVFAYFEEPDRTCHSVGVESQETINQIVKADVTVKYLLDQIKCENLEKKLNLIILSDHGMESITYDHIIFLESYASNMTYKMIVTGPNAFVYPNPGKFDEVYANFTKAAESGTFNVYKQDQIPERWHFKNSPRLKGLIYLLAEPSYMFWYDILNITAKDEFKVGTHGYDNANERMNTIFMASGPAFKSNYTAEPFESVDVYPLLSHVAGLKTPGTAGARPCNGTMDTVRHMLRQDAPSAAVRPPSRRRSQGVWAAVLLHAAVATVTRCL